MCVHMSLYLSHHNLLLFRTHGLFAAEKGGGGSKCGGRGKATLWVPVALGPRAPQNPGQDELPGAGVRAWHSAG